MSEPKRRENLQHEAEHTKPHNMSVAGYLLILFAAAFLLLLLAFFQQQRASSDTIEGLQASVSAMSSIQDMIDQRDQLQTENEALVQERDSLAGERDALKDENTLAADRLLAVNKLNELRALYNKGRYNEARELIEAGKAFEMEKRLTEVSAALTEEERNIYDPLKSYQTLVGWLI